MAYVIKNTSTYMGSAIIEGVGRRIAPSETITVSAKPTSTSPNVKVFQIEDVKTPSVKSAGTKSASSSTASSSAGTSSPASLQS